jgi:signal transduction histidine kinase
LETFFEPAKERVLISVSDTGAGIHPELIDKIFNPFFTTKPPGEGTGLGLSVSYGIIQDHNGRIEVRSEINKGSTFTIVLPLKEEPVVADAISKKWIAETGR